MPTLQIEHQITDYPTWKAAFDRFAPARKQAGVLRHLIRQPVDDAHYVVLELDFASTAAAEGFLAFLRTNVWSSSTNSPALSGSPRARVVRQAEEISAA